MFAVFDIETRQPKGITRTMTPAAGTLNIPITQELFQRFAEDPFALNHFVLLKKDEEFVLEEVAQLTFDAVTMRRLGQLSDTDVCLIIRPSHVFLKCCSSYPKTIAHLFTFLKNGNPYSPLSSIRIAPNVQTMMEYVLKADQLYKADVWKDAQVYISNPYREFTYSVKFEL